MKKNYKNIEFNHNEFKAEVIIKEDTLHLTLINKAQTERFYGEWENKQFPKQLKMAFITMENMYWYFKDLASNQQKIMDNCILNTKEGILCLKIKQILAGVQIQRDCSINLLVTKLTNSQHIEKKQSQQITKIIEVETSQEDKIKQKAQETYELELRIKQLSEQVGRFEQELTNIKTQINLDEFIRKVKSFQKKQQFIINKIINNEEKILKINQDKKQFKAIFDQSTELLANQIEAIKLQLAEIAKNNPIQSQISKNKARTQITSNHSIIEQTEEKQQEEEEYTIDQPLIYSRNSEISSTADRRSRHSSISLSEQELERIRMGSHDIQLLTKKLKQLDRKFEIYIPPKLAKLNFQSSAYMGKYKLEDERQDSFMLVKKPDDRKAQLVGAAIPPNGRYYFKVKLLIVPHGYIHVGVVSGTRQFEQSSHSDADCINYFGGNGSLTIKGDGFFIGKQLQNQDMLITLIDMDLGWIKFILKNQIIAEAKLQGMSKERGLHPYVQLFYGKSRIQIQNY